MFETWSALAVFGLTLLLVMLRPRGITESVAALVGGGLMLVLGRVQLAEAAQVLLDRWDVFLFFLGLMTIAAVADSAGFFDWAAAAAMQLAKGSGLRLFLNVFILGALISTFLSNDATALILTPVVYTLTTRLRLNPLPFMFACTFIADTASFTLPVSNPINILITGAFPQAQDLGTFLRHLLAASLVAIGLNILLFVLIFRRQLPRRFKPEEMELPVQVIEQKGRSFFRFVSVCLVFIAVGYVTASLVHLPLSFVGLAGGLGLVAGAAYFKRLSWRKLSGEISWPIFLFIGGMFIVVQGVSNTGFTREMGRALVNTAGDSPLLAVLVGTFGTALGANLINNVPMSLVMISALQQIDLTAVSPAVHNGLIFSSILGADLGPNLTTAGSLATVLWLLILRRKGVEVSPLQYFKLGVIVTPIMLLAGALTIWVSLLI
jgi:arsenical pump membrane protein